MHLPLLLLLISVGLALAGAPCAAAEAFAAQAPSSSPTTSATAQPDDASRDLARQARKLVRQLDSPEIAERDQAFDALVKLGPEVLAHLPSAADNAPAAVRDAVRRLRREFDRQAADEAMQAATITLDGQEIPLTKVAEAFEKQTGNKLILETPPEATVDLDLKGVPFWKALDTLADAAKLSVYSFAQDGLRIRPALPNQRPRGEGVFYTGPLRFQAMGLRLEHDPRLNDPAMLHVGLEIAWEPRLRPITLRQKLELVAASDEQGNTVTIAGQGERSALVHQGSSAIEIELPFRAPPRSVESIAKLKGTIDVLVPGKLVAFEFGDLANAKRSQQQRHNATVSLAGVRKVNEVWEIRVSVKYDDAFNAFDSHLVSWLLNNEAYLLNGKQERVENAGFETTNRSEDEIGVAYFFDVPQGLDGHKFVYKTPSAIYQLPVEYQLSDLKLP